MTTKGKKRGFQAAVSEREAAGIRAVYDGCKSIAQTAAAVKRSRSVVSTLVAAGRQESASKEPMRYTPAAREDGVEYFDEDAYGRAHII